MPGRTPLHLPALSASVLRPAFLPPNQECSTDSSGPPDPLPPSDDLDWGPPCFPCDFLLRSSTPPAHPVFPSTFSAPPRATRGRQTISIGAHRVSPAISFCARRHRRRIQFSRQLSQHFREYFFRISLHRTSRFRPLQAWFTPLRRLAMLLQGSISFFM